MKARTIVIHSLLFIATFATCMMAGAQWAFKDFWEITNWIYGIEYAALVMIFLSFHEFGHYFAARLHGVDVTLPYYIPFPFTFAINFGTFGAVIKTRTPILSRKALFDIGVAGPLAGFVVCVLYLIYGLNNLPPIDFIYAIHPEYLLEHNGIIPSHGLYFGNTILYSSLSNLIATGNGFLPPMNEIYHYPFLNVGWFGLFVTTLNMMPIGQLDGGHISYAMFGRKIQFKIAKITWWILMTIGFFAILSFVREFLSLQSDIKFVIFLKDIFLTPLNFLYNLFPIAFQGWGGWLIWGLIAKFFIKLRHPRVEDESPIGTKRIIIGWISFVILFLSFSYSGIYIIE